MNTVTVSRKGKRFVSEFSQLPGKTFGPWDFSEMVRDLTVSALLHPMDARDLVLTAHEHGSVTTEVRA